MTPACFVNFNDFFHCKQFEPH